MYIYIYLCIYIHMYVCGNTYTDKYNMKTSSRDASRRWTSPRLRKLAGSNGIAYDESPLYVYIYMYVSIIRNTTALSHSYYRESSRHQGEYIEILYRTVSTYPAMHNKYRQRWFPSPYIPRLSFRTNSGHRLRPPRESVVGGAAL